MQELAWGASLAGGALDPRVCPFDMLVASDVCYDEVCNVISAMRSSPLAVSSSQHEGLLLHHIKSSQQICMSCVHGARRNLTPYWQPYWSVSARMVTCWYGPLPSHV